MKKQSVTLPCRFGFLPEGDQHHFCIHLPSDISEDITIQERFIVPDPERPLTRDKRARMVASISGAVWREIAPVVLREFCGRGTKAKRSAELKIGENWLPRLLGKELCVLAWALENADQEQRLVALQRWTNLTSEERWWLFNMASADFGEKAKGWKLAVQVALCDKAVEGERNVSKSIVEKNLNSYHG